MTYCDWNYLFLFLPITILMYNIFPQKHRGKILLLASYLFFLSISSKLIIYLLIATAIMYGYGIAVDKINNKRDDILKSCNKEDKKKIKQDYMKYKRWLLVVGLLVLLLILIILKYSYFIGENVNILFKSNIKLVHFAIPIGISFYTLQAISYMVDVYKEKIKPDKNLGRVALFISFFPQIMEGPICRYQDTAEQLWSGSRTTYKGLTFGTQRIGLGLMKKMIIADRLDILVSNIFKDYEMYDGGIVTVGMILYTLQLYMDFSGVMDIVIGTAELFNVRMPENFKQPFFSQSISEFWTRWHITLGTWFKDYIYFPVSMSNKSKKLTSTLRKKIGKYYGPLLTSSFALLCVWLCNGIWHGSAWNYIFFGLYHFVFIMIGRIAEPISKKLCERIKIDYNNILLKVFRIIRTTILVFFGELFFRADGLTNGFNMFKKILLNFKISSIDTEILKLGLDKHDFIIILVFTIVFFIISVLKEKGINIRESIAQKNIVIRWLIYLAVIIAVITFGAYGEGYIPVDPMYAQF